jgi:hypothetical protein
MTEKQREHMESETRVLEIEFSYWCRLFSTRSVERDDVKLGLVELAEKKQKQMSLLEEYTKELDSLRTVSARVCGGSWTNKYIK